MKKSHIARFDQSMSRPLASRSRSLRSFGETFGQKQKRIGDKHESCPKNVKYKRKERNFKRMKENESQTPPLCISFQICVYLPKSKDPGIHVNIGHPRKLLGFATQNILSLKRQLSRSLHPNLNLDHYPTHFPHRPLKRKI